MFGVGYNELRTSMMVIGPPGSGKTGGLAVPVVEDLSLGALSGAASMVVIDPKGTDSSYDGWFDITIDPLNPTHGFSLVGGAPDAAQAADRLADALLPTNMSDDKAYFRDASYNALYDCLGPFHTAYERWPTIRELLSLLRANQDAIGKVKSGLKGVTDRTYCIDHLHNRERQAQGSHPAASLVERFARLDRPALRKIFDHPKTVAMRDINRSTRGRFALPDAEYLEASRIIARLVVSQFVRTTAAADTNTSIFKGLVMDEAGRYVDDYVTHGVQKVRSNNAGLVLLTQSFADFPEDVRNTVVGSTGCKAVLGGVDLLTADHLSQWFGDEWITDTTITRGHSTGVNYDITPFPHLTGYRKQQGQSVSSRRIERARWTPSDIISRIPIGHSVTALSTTDGHRVGPMLINHRG